ncbi:MAG: NPCBM/NEW2 domain-containing protein [Caulobacteraceae bacterium]
MKVSKEMLKGILVGVIITSFVFCTIFAAPVTKSIQVVFSGVKIALDGKILDLKDASGKKVEPFQYNGTTYLPIRAVANAFGKDVSFDEKENTIYLGEVVKPNGLIVGIGDMTPFTKSKMMLGIAWEQGKRLKMNNTEYDSKDALICSGIGANGSSSVVYALEGNYTSISGVFGVDDSSPDPVNGRITDIGASLQLIGDGNVLYETSIATKGGSPIKVNDINLIGVKQLTIKILDNNKSSDVRYRYNFAQVKLTKKAN